MQKTRLDSVHLEFVKAFVGEKFTGANRDFVKEGCWW
jgi:hypothetical protein